MAESSRTAGETRQAEMLEEIAKKTPSVTFLSTGFNKAAVALLEKFGLPDEKIVSPFIKNHPRFKILQPHLSIEGRSPSSVVAAFGSHLVASSPARPVQQEASLFGWPSEHH